MVREPKPVTRQDIIDCYDCREHQINDPHLEMMFRYLADFHRGGHRERVTEEGTNAG
jgi:hypothetical protein